MGAATNIPCPDFTLIAVIPKCHEQGTFRSFLIAVPLYVLLKEGQGFQKSLTRVFTFQGDSIICVHEWQAILTKVTNKDLCFLVDSIIYVHEGQARLETLTGIFTFRLDNIICVHEGQARL